MVSVELTSEYINKIEENDPIIQLFISLLFKRDINIENDLDFSNLNDVIKACIFSLYDEKYDKFKMALEVIKKRKPKPTTIWISNDIFLFLIITAAKKAKITDEWIDNVVQIRVVMNEEAKIIKQSFINILNDNLDSTDNIKSLIIVFKSLLNKNIEDNELLNKEYSLLTSKAFPYYDSHFLNLISLRAIQVIILSKGLVDYDKIEKLNLFSETFDIRTKKLAKIYWIITVLLFFIPSVLGSIWMAYFYIINDTEYIEFFYKVNKLTSLLGIKLGLFSLFTLSIKMREKIINYFIYLNNKFWGKKI